LKPSLTALSTGAGAVGHLCARVAIISGASSIVMIDVDDARLEFARKHHIADKTSQMPLRGTKGESSSDFSLSQYYLPEHGPIMYRRTVMLESVRRNGSSWIQG